MVLLGIPAGAADSTQAHGPAGVAAGPVGHQVVLVCPEVVPPAGAPGVLVHQGDDVEVAVSDQP